MDKNYNSLSQPPQANDGKKHELADWSKKPGSTREKSLGEKMAKAFIAADIRDVKTTVVQQYLVPGLKQLFFNIIAGGLGMLLGVGSFKGGNLVSGGSSSQTAYNKYFGNSTNANPVKPAASCHFEERIFDTKEDANAFFNDICEYVAAYQYLTVAIYHESIGVSVKSAVENNYGWVDLSRCEIVQDTRRGNLGWRVAMPDPIYLKK